MIENQKPILGADRAKKLATVYRALRPLPKDKVVRKDFTSKVLLSVSTITLSETSVSQNH